MNDTVHLIRLVSGVILWTRTRWQVLSIVGCLSTSWTLGVATGAKNVMEWILQPIFMKIPILETHWHQEEPWQMSLTYIEVLWICPLDRRLFKLQFVNSVCKICQNLNRKCGNNSISCLKHCFLKNNMWKNKQNTTTWYKCRVFCWDFDTFCRLN